MPDPAPPAKVLEFQQQEALDLKFTAAPEAAQVNTNSLPLGTMQAQIALDRAGFSPRVIDGKNGETFKLALRRCQAANNLTASGNLDEKTTAALSKVENRPPTRLVRIPAGFARQTFFPDLPKDAAEQAKMPTIGRAESHGCVRLTNWDVARLSQMIGKLGIRAVFQS